MPKSESKKDTKQVLKSSKLYRKLKLLSAHFLYKKHLKAIADLKVAVHLHLYYIDLLDEFIENLKNIPIPFDLYITLVERPASDIKKIFQTFPNAKIFTLPNQRNDIGAFVEVINNINLNAYDALIKIHSKKSLHTGAEQKEWRQRLVKSLIGSPKQNAAVLYEFCNKKTGMVGGYEDLCFFECEDKKAFVDLCKKLEINADNIFFKGTMFAIRPKILSRLIEKRICLSDFNPLDVKINPYAVERIFGSLCINQGYKIKALESVS